MEEKQCSAYPIPDGPLTNWEQICHYYYGILPGFKCSVDKEKDEEPRWLFKGVSPCKLCEPPNENLPEKDSWPCLAHDSNHPASRVACVGCGPFKDHKSLKNHFKSRLDKAFEEFGLQEADPALKHEIEWGLMRTFRRKAHLHTGSRGDNWLERLGLMAHYEAPHRLVDWTYSFFVAVYFAINGEYNKGNALIWALNKRWLTEHAKQLETRILKKAKLKLRRAEYNKLLRFKKSEPDRFTSKMLHYLMLDNRERTVYPVTPYYQNERISIQQGTLLAAGTINCTWGANLAAVLKKEKGKSRLIGIPIQLKMDARKEVLNQLNSMNINQATLFPDLDGFARSLRTRLADPESIKKRVPPLGAFEP